MHEAVYLPFVLSAVLAVLAPALATRLAPAMGARLLLVAGLACAGSSVLALGALAATAAGRFPLVAGLAGWSWHVIRRDDPVRPWVGAVSALILVAVSLLTVRELLRRGVALYRSWRTCRDLTGSLVVLDDPAPDAYALPGGRIIVSRGMLRALSADERRVMLAHEAAHLRHRHYLYRAGAALVAAVNPLLWTLPGAIDHATERWADEVAAVQVGDRRLAARALAHAALATTRNGGDRLGFGGHDVPRRVQALLERPPVRRPLATSLLAAMILVTVFTTHEVGGDADAFFDHAAVTPAAEAMSPHVP